MPRPSTVAVRRPASLLVSTVLVLSCTDKPAGPNENRGPTATITVPSGPIIEGSEVTFDARSSSDPDGDTLTYLWNVGDGVPRTTALAARTYVDDGAYDVMVIVSDQLGSSDTATTQVSIENAAPHLDSIVTPVGSILVGTLTAIRVSAHDLGSTDSLTIQVDWKDGNTSSLNYQDPMQEVSLAHTYSTAGTYQVEVTVRDNDGGITTQAVARPITVVLFHPNQRPTARITRSVSGPIIEGGYVAFDARSSSDPDGDTLTYLWNVGYPGQRTFPFINRRYLDEGSYETTIIVTDQHGASDTATTQVDVRNAPPGFRQIVVPAGSITLGTSTAIRFSASDPGIDDSLTVLIDWQDGDTSTLLYEYDYHVPGVTLFPLVNVAHTYSTAGNYAVEVTLQDNDGGVTKQVIEKPILVVGPHENHLPMARIDGPASGNEGALLTFSGAASTDPDGDSLRVICHSEGGQNPYGYPGYPERSCDLSFPDNGTYLVSAIAVDDSGAADTASMSVTILNLAPKVEWLFVPTHEAVGVPGSIQVLVDDPGTADRDTIVVDWGDGTGQTLAAADTSIWVPYDGQHELGGTVFHTYRTTGSYTITVTAHDDDGGVSNAITSSSPVIVFNANERQTVAGYTAMDLGTLGGNWARPADLNDRGQIVGTSMTDHWALHAFLWDETGMHDLGTMGRHASEAVRINEAGLIAGTAWERGTGTLDDNCISSAVGTTWQNGVATSLGGQGFCHNTYDPYGGLSGQWQPRLVRAMNSSGDIALIGYGKFDIRSRLWRNGWQQMPLPSPWYPFYPTAMNDRGQAVGTAHQGEGSPLFHAFLWEDGAGRDLGILAPTTCERGVDCDKAAAQDINESGQIVGISTGAGHYHFVLWQDDKIEDLGLADWSTGEPGPRIVLNNHGDIAGSAGGKAYFWSGGVKTQLPSAGGALEVVQLNENGDVVGNILMGGRQHVFVWSQSRGLVDLGTGPDGFDAAWVVDVNARGDILGYTAPCKLTYESPTHCTDYAVDYWARQVRAILWRNTR